MEVFNFVKKLIENGEIVELVAYRPIYSHLAMNIIINYTDNVAMAEEILKYYLQIHKYEELTVRFLDEPDTHINFKLEKIDPKMREWIKKHSDVFLKPFSIIRLSKFHNRIIAKDNYFF